ncbi:MAG TPA: lamin tail domain-containing protein [Kiritimatiellia bacterium]|nr:lamin tail domain-containing protein [Kiritimatiellia bacterium]HRZ12079.1 lamin tail domain-containing protein [Kiritimatiellia bacterium]HSA18163.1 lamin tail domain-containing protein [Kiritimatiellia bacterium]
MKKLMGIALMLLLSVTARATLVITEAMSSSNHTNTFANGDWWELYNDDTVAVDLTNYSWDDNSATPGSANFNGLSIGAGEFLIISQETIGEEDSWRTIWGIPSSVAVVNLGNTEFQNFSASGDAIYLYSPSSVQIASITFGTATAGYSFEWDKTGTSLGLSVVGENGAFQSTSMGGGPDVGSPGAIPEPGTLALVAGGLAALLMRRHLQR